jgi:DNA repair protein RadC
MASKSNNTSAPASSKPKRTRKPQRNTQPPFEDTFIRETRVSYVLSQQASFKIRSASDVATFVRSILTDNSREHFIAMFLDAMHQVAAYSVVSIGTANSAPVTPREVYQRAIVAGAIAIAVAHNHPSGSPLPSDEDHKVTKRLFESGVLLGIKLLDHVVVTDNEHYSFSENGVL